MARWSAKDWQDDKPKRILLFGMSGLGKTYLSQMLRASNEWFHYSVDYRIGTRYMGEHIVDNFKAHAMGDPFLAELLRTDSIYIASNITFENLTPLSTYLGKPGDPALGGLSFAEYQRRQALHTEAERAALRDTSHFIDRAQALYGYDHFVCDTSGSICEVVDAYDPNDPLLNALAEDHVMVWIKGSEAHTEELVRRFDKAPKPMCYQPEFLADAWREYLRKNNCSEGEVKPNEFIRWTYARALAHRQPRYEAIANNFGITVSADEVAAVEYANDLDLLIQSKLP